MLSMYLKRNQRGFAILSHYGAFAMITAYVAVSPVTGSGVTHIGLSLSHCKDRKVVNLYAYPVERKPDGRESVLIMRSESMPIEAMPRLNRKRLADIESKVQNSVSMETGYAWDLVTHLCTQRGYHPVSLITSAQEHSR